MNIDKESLLAFDLQHIWHPFTQERVWREENALIIERGDGVELIDVEGRRYLDGVSSLWCNVHGHGHPAIVQAIKSQADKLCHSTLLGLSHVPIIELTKLLLQYTPKNLNRVFYADSGSTAVEAALRMALEWWNKSGTPGGKNKNRILSLVGGYHGDTLGAVSVGYLEVFHQSLKNSIVPALRTTPPHVFRFEEGLSAEQSLEQSVAELKGLLKKESDNIAAFIIEPLVQGAAGMWIHPVEYLREVAALCKQHDVLLITDEVATGFGKMGEMFAVGAAEVEPDILVVGKGLSGGYLPISAAITSEELFSGFSAAPEEFKTFYYGQTFAGNPLAASASVANLKVFDQAPVLESVRKKIPYFHQMLDKHLSPLSHVDEVRRQGLMVGIELTKEKGKRVPYPTAEQVGIKITRKARELGVIIRPLGNVIVLMPALVMGEKDLERLVTVSREAIVSVLGE